MKLYKLLISIIVIVQLVSLIQGNTLTQVLDDTENYLDQLVQRSQALYASRCTGSTQSCTTKIFDECGTNIPELTCHQEYPTPDGCDEVGGYLNFEETGGRCANNENCNTSEDLQIMCSQAELFADLQGNNLRFDQDDDKKLAYVGFYNSFRIVYPYLHEAFDDNGQCQEYDPRYRPWYVGASTGAKNIIVAIDKSGSMNQNGKKQVAQEAARSVINTLGVSDWFQILLFSDTSKQTETVSSSNTLIQATIENKEKALLMIQNMYVDANTNYELAFQKIFDIYDNTSDQEFGNRGENIILFLSDGDITQGLGKDTPQDLYDYIDTENSSLDAAIFTYALGNDIDGTILSTISCGHRGIYHTAGLTDSEELAETMRTYYTYLSKSVEFQNTVWSEEYTDAFTNLSFVTASSPIYVDSDVNGQKILLGVAGVDLYVGELEKLDGYPFSLEERQAKTRQDQNTALPQMDDCDLEQLRGVNNCAVVGCSGNDYAEYATCNLIFAQTPWSSQGVDYENYEEVSLCCLEPDPDYVDPGKKKITDQIEDSLSGGAVAGIVIGAIFGIVIIIIVVACVIRKQKAQKEDGNRLANLRQAQAEQLEANKKAQQAVEKEKEAQRRLDDANRNNQMQQQELQRIQQLAAQKEAEARHAQALQAQKDAQLAQANQALSAQQQQYQQQQKEHADQIARQQQEAAQQANQAYFQGAGDAQQLNQQQQFMQPQYPAQPFVQPGQVGLQGVAYDMNGNPIGNPLADNNVIQPPVYPQAPEDQGNNFQQGSNY